jgi:hypothetical protein
MKYRPFTKWSGKETMELEDRIKFGKAHVNEKLRVVLYSDPLWVQFCIDRGYIIPSAKAKEILLKNLEALKSAPTSKKSTSKFNTLDDETDLD